MISNDSGQKTLKISLIYFHHLIILFHRLFSFFPDKNSKLLTYHLCGSIRFYGQHLVLLNQWWKSDKAETVNILTPCLTLSWLLTLLALEWLRPSAPVEFKYDLTIFRHCLIFTVNVLNRKLWRLKHLNSWDFRIESRRVKTNDWHLLQIMQFPNSTRCSQILSSYS